MRPLIRQNNNNTTPFNIYILVFVTFWVFVKLYILVVGVCRKSAKNNQKWRLFVYVGQNNMFIAVCLCLKVELSCGLICMTLIFLFFFLYYDRIFHSSFIFTKFGLL